MDVNQALKIDKYLKVHNKDFQYLYSPTTKVGCSYSVMK